MAAKLRKLEKALRKQTSTAITCSAFGSSVRLEGELANWDAIVRAGRAAAKYGFKGVVNDIRLKNLTQPPTQLPCVRDALYENAQPDVLIIGGGVIGCAIARELTRHSLSVLILEKESDVAMHASSRNDGMIHPGIASHAGTLRAEMNVRGNAMYTALCKELSIPFERWSSLILYEEAWLAALAKPILLRRSRQLGIPGRQVNRAQLRQIEPFICDAAVAGFDCPSSGVLSPYKLTVALAENAIENGAAVALETAVLGMTKQNGRIASVQTNRGTIHPRLVVNAAGVFADLIADMAGDRFFSIHPRKGECAILDKNQGQLVQRSMGMIHAKMYFSDTKGGGVMRTIDGNVLVGPDAYEQPLREDFSTNRAHMDALLEKHLPLIKGFSRADVIAYFAGIRAANYEEEFIIEPSERVGNLVHAAGIQSPGLAAAPAIAQRIAQQSLAILQKEMTVTPNPRFDPVRKAAPVMAKLDLEEKQALIRQNPDYGVVVCRCEGISKGEIAAALHSPLPANSLDALKRRVRPGMGRCQGGFCMPPVAQIICDESGLPFSSVSKSGQGSELLFGAEDVRSETTHTHLHNEGGGTRE